MDVDLIINFLKALASWLNTWAETAFYTVSSLVLLATVVTAVWRFRVFRMGRPHVRIDLTVTSRRSSPRYNALSAIAVVTNTSRVFTRCTEMTWRVRVLAPYTDRDVQAKADEHAGNYPVTGAPMEFPWNRNYELNQKGARIYLEPGESNTLIMNLAIPGWIEAVDVEAELLATADRIPEVWVARCIHDVEGDAQWESGTP